MLDIWNCTFRSGGEGGVRGRTKDDIISATRKGSLATAHAPSVIRNSPIPDIKAIIQIVPQYPPVVCLLTDAGHVRYL